MISATRYTAADADAWDAFVQGSRNGTFLLQRGFMDYHADRFRDHSLLLHDDGRLVGLLPAHLEEAVLHSHGGLTYGGLVLGPRTGTVDTLAMLDAVRAHARAAGCTAIRYKTIPWIYHRQPAEDDRYALFRAGARLVRRDVLAVVGRDERMGFQQRRTRGVRAARRAGVEIAASMDLAGYWPLLEATLQEHHDARPVHSLAEISQLQQRFPAQVRLFLALLAGTPIAGVLVFETDRVGHAQYIAAGAAGRAVGALDLLFDHLLSGVYRDKPWFDFGISNEDDGRVLNTGLIAHKEGFGARAVVHDHYLLATEAADD